MTHPTLWSNPLGFTDPTGHWGLSNIKKWCGNPAKDVGKAATAAAKAVVNNIDYVQAAIDVAGLIPVVGEAFDAVNAGIYAARGDYVSTGLSLAACIPIAGTAATAAKLAKTAVKALDKAQSLKKVTKAVGASGIARRTEVVERAMSRAEPEATKRTGLLRGGKSGIHYVSDSVNSKALRARQRLALDATPEVRVRLLVPSRTVFITD